MKKISIVLFNEYREIFEDGSIVRHLGGGRIVKGSKDWLFTGITLVNNFGNCTGYLSINEFFEVFENNKNSLYFKNEKPKFLFNDIDHGINRSWGERPLKYKVNLIK